VDLTKLSAYNAIDLVDYGQDAADVDYVLMIQSFHRFLFEHLSSEGNAFPRNPVIVAKPGQSPAPSNSTSSPITQLLGIDAKNIITCSNCGTIREKENMTHIVDLVYPRKVSVRNISRPGPYIE
jgi:PAB-dependent poly(A)-specific ribonuclease subunit 2